MYDLKVISLENCPYSINIEKLLKHNKIKHNLIRVSAEEKDKFKTNKINTFPQFYLEKNKQTILLGGNNDLKEILEISKNKKLNEMVINLNKKFPELEKKILLRILELFI